jgi:hypothetical protein
MTPTLRRVTLRPRLRTKLGPARAYRNRREAGSVAQKANHDVAFAPIQRFPFQTMLSSRAETGASARHCQTFLRVFAVRSM